MQVSRKTEPVRLLYCRLTELGCPVLVGYQDWDELADEIGKYRDTKRGNIGD